MYQKQSNTELSGQVVLLHCTLEQRVPCTQFNSAAIFLNFFDINNFNIFNFNHFMSSNNRIPLRWNICRKSISEKEKELTDGYW